MCRLPEFARLLALALLNYADDHGFFWANPVLIRGALFPFEEDAKKIGRSLMELAKIEYLRVGKCPDGRQAGQICNFGKHQRVDKPQRSEIATLVSFEDHSGMDLGLFGSEPEAPLELMPAPAMPKPVSSVRVIDEPFEALVAVEQSDLARLTKSGRGRLNKALSEIRAVEPGVAAERIHAAAAAWRRKYPQTPVTCSALAAHWSRLTKAPETEKDFQEREVRLAGQRRARRRLAELEDQSGAVPIPREELSEAELAEVARLRQELAYKG